MTAHASNWNLPPIDGTRVSRIRSITDTCDSMIWYVHNLDGSYSQRLQFTSTFCQLLVVRNVNINYYVYFRSSYVLSFHHPSNFINVAPLVVLLC